MADMLTNVFSYLGILYVLLTKLLSGDINELDQLWNAPQSLAQQNSILPQIEGNGRVLVGNIDNDPLDRAMDSLMLMLNYFDARIDEEPVIDVFITVRIIADYCRHMNLNMLPNEYQKEKLQAIMSLADDVVKRGEVAIKLTNPTYYNQLKEAFSIEMFQDGSKFRTLPNVTYDKSLVQEDTFNGANTDKCFQEIFSCLVSDACWQKMTILPHQSGYMLTHQVLYIIMAQGRCSNVAAEYMVKFNQSSFEKINDDFCGPVYAQSLDIVQQNFPERYHDLFCEQTFVCGMLGYYQFLSIPIFDNILSWQDNVGCYKYRSWETISLFKLYNGNGRRKRNEIMKKDMCMPHYTVVCGTAVAVFLKYLMEDHSLSFESIA